MTDPDVQQGKREGIEEAAKVAEQGGCPNCHSSDAADDIAAAIRQKGAN